MWVINLAAISCISTFSKTSAYTLPKDLSDLDKLEELRHPFSAQIGVLVPKEKYVDYEEILSKYDLDPVKYDSRVPHCSNVKTCADRQPYWCKSTKIQRPTYAYWACYKQEGKILPEIAQTGHKHKILECA